MSPAGGTAEDGDGASHRRGRRARQGGGGARRLARGAGRPFRPLWLGDVGAAAGDRAGPGRRADCYHRRPHGRRGGRGQGFEGRRSVRHGRWRPGRRVRRPAGADQGHDHGRGGYRRQALGDRRLRARHCRADKRVPHPGHGPVRPDGAGIHDRSVQDLRDQVARALPPRLRQFGRREDNSLDRAGAAVPRHGTARGATLPESRHLPVLSVPRPAPPPAKEPTMLIVDAQIHLWNAGNPTSPWHRQIPAHLKEDALKEMDAGGVDAAILTPHTPLDPNANELCMEAARAHPDRFAILGNFPLDKPESRALVDTWKQRPGMLGCRFTFIGPEQSKWPTDGTVDWLWPAAERAGLPIAMMAANFLPDVGDGAGRHPNLKLILDHLGRPRGDTSPSERWANLADVLALAKYPNIAMKATGAPSYSDQPYPFRDIHDNLHRLYDAFGPARWFWGTDITRMPCSWRQCVTLFTEELPWLKGRDLELVIGRAGCDWLGWW